jgi:hypothetical protein
VAPQQVGRDAAFMEKDTPPEISQWLPPLPLPTGGGDIKPALPIGV